MKKTLRAASATIGFILVCVLLNGCGLVSLQATQAALPDYNEGQALMRAGRPREAIAAFDRSLAINPKMGNRGRGDANLELGNYDAAIADYTKSVEMGGGNDYGRSWTYIYRAQAFYGKGDYGRAWADVDRARDGGLLIEKNAKLSAFLRKLERVSNRPG